ncbi:MAG: SusC/RagA family TonB-linked outer membrane protein [Gemmatimonadales bacterium]
MNQKGPGLCFALVVLATLASAGAQQIAAQNAVFRGTVRSDRGEPLPGAIVYIAELNIIAPTTVEGTYVLTVPGARARGQQFALRAKAIGYKPGTQAVNLVAGDQTLDFTLGLDIHLLEAVVVTGVTGETEQIKVPFAVTRIEAAQMPVPAVNPLTQLQGKVPGVTVKTTTGRPGQQPAIIIRGPKAINASGRGQEPLYIVDGVRVTGSLPDINPQDIESVEIVRGAAGASLYGSTAGSGVVHITTKSARGGVDQVQFHLRTEAGVSDIERDFGLARNHTLLMDETNQFFCQSVSGQPQCARIFDYATEAARINNVLGDSARTPAGFPIDPGASTPALALRSLFQSKRWPGQTFNAVDQTVNPQPFYTNAMDVTGRFGSTSVFASFANTHEGGAIRFLTGYDRNSVRLNVDQRIGSDWAVGVRSYYARSTADGLNQVTGNDAFFRLTRVPGNVNVLQRDTLGRLFIRPNLQASGAQNQNPLYPLENIQREDVNNRFIGGAHVRYTPLDWLDIEGSAGYDGLRVKFGQFQDKGFRATTQGFAATQSVGSVFRGDSSAEALSIGLNATIRRTHLGGALRSRVNLRYGYDRIDTDFRSGAGNTLAVQGVTTLDNTAQATRSTVSRTQSERLVDFAGGLNLEYKERYIVDAVIRRDGSSLFGVDNRWQTFGRASLAWRLTQEPWWPTTRVNELKLRGSYGTSGGRPRYDAQYETFTVGAGGIVSPTQLGNTSLGPERNTELELGADMLMFDRLLINGTYARSETKDQILEVPVERASGFASQWRNAGTLRTTSWELTLNMPIIQRPNLTWSLGFTYDRHRTFIKEMSVAPFSFGSATQATTTMFRAVPGERFGTFYGRKFLTSCSELPAPLNADCGGAQSAFQFNDDGFLVWVGRGNSWRDGISENLWQEALPGANAPWGVGLNWGMPIILRDNTGAARTVPLGNSLPDFRFSVTQNFRWKHLTVYALLDASIGQDVWNQGRHWAHLDFLAREIDQEGKSVETAKPIGYYWRAGPPDQAGLGGFYDLLAPNNRFVEDASYAKLRELLVSYAIGPILGVGNWEVSVVGRNLFTITDYKGFDPEVGQAGGNASSALLNAVDAFTFPSLRSLTFGLSTSF